MQLTTLDYNRLKTLTVPVEHEVFCCDCNTRMRLKWARDKHRLLYVCGMYPTCQGKMPADADGYPSSTQVPFELRKARIRARVAFSALWSGVPDDEVAIAQEQAVAWLAYTLAIQRSQCCIGGMTEDACEKVVSLCLGVTREDIRNWCFIGPEGEETYARK